MISFIWKRIAFVCSLVTLIICIYAPAAQGQTLKISAAGDITCTDSQRDLAPTSAWLFCAERQVANGMKSEGPNHVLALGDLTQQWGTLEMLDKFATVWSPVINLVRPTIGNHEYLGYDNNVQDPETYFNFWSQRDLSFKYLGENQKFWSAWKSNSVRFISLNSNCNIIDCDSESEQSRWLQKVLEADQSKGFKGCTIAYFHHPLFSVGNRKGQSSENGLNNLWQILHKFRTDIVLNGHQHYYERYARMSGRGVISPNGPVQFIVGTGGHSGWSPQEAGPLLSTSRFAIRSPGSLNIKFENNSWSSYFKRINGKRVDRFSARCLQKP